MRSYVDFVIWWFYVMIVSCILVMRLERIVRSFRSNLCYINQYYVWIGADYPLQSPNPWRGEQTFNKNFMHFRFITKLLSWLSVAECLWRRQSCVAQLVWTTLSQFTPPHPIWRSSLMLFSHQRWRGPFPSGLLTEIIYTYRSSSTPATFPAHFFLFCLTINMFGRVSVRITF